MRLRGIVALICAVLVVGMALSLYTIRQMESATVDMAAINDIVRTVERHWGNMEAGDYSAADLSFTVVDNGENVLYQSEVGQHATVHEALRNRDTIVDLMQEGNVSGKLIVHYNDREHVGQIRKQLTIVVIAVFLLLGASSLAYIAYIQVKVFKPFHTLKRFAINVAGGVLDVPLAMDKHNRFGAFTESFDLMREALAEARRREIEASRGKKELMAGLSHDIRTPVASIKAVTELMLMQAVDAKTIKQLNAIHAKSEQINLLVTDMFHATLEELQQLKVTVAEESSAALASLIEYAKDVHDIICDPIPACLIEVDVIRFQQVLDNVLGNAYKYAGTPIAITSRMTDSQLELHIMDDGPGIGREELALVFNKFYRGSNAEGIDGSGLGLYISKYFMEHMNGDMECRNRPDGLTVVLKLKLV